MKRKLKKRIVGTVLFVVGVGFCIGGVFLPPLLIPGAAIIGSGLTMLGDSFLEKEQHQVIEENIQVQMAPNSTINFNHPEHRHHQHQEPVVLLGMAEAMENHEKVKI